MDAVRCQDPSPLAVELHPPRPLPAEAVRLGWKAVLAEHPSTPRRRRLSLFERADRIGGQDASGWVRYRIVRDNDQESLGVAQTHAA